MSRKRACVWFHLVAAVVGFFGLALLAVFLWLESQLGLDAVGVIIAAPPVVLLGGLALAIDYYARSIRLELTDRSVAPRLPGGFFAADWADVERIQPAAWDR